MERSVSIPVGGVELQADLRSPPDAKGIVIFAHGSGSSRHSPRNQYVANILYNGPYATLLMDLLTVDEEMIDFRTARYRFDIELLAGRLVAATDWASRDLGGEKLPIGYFGASTGAAAALVAATRRRDLVKTIISRGGRPDLAGQEALSMATQPTLFIVGGLDTEVQKLTRASMGRMTRAETELVIVPRATHLFEEPGALEEVARLAAQWFDLRLAPGRMAATA
jgi:putative phosphoribosyl transferase